MSRTNAQDPEHPIDGYRNLWLAVLMRALRDALLEEDANPDHAHNFWWPIHVADKKTIPLVRDRARFWLTEDKQDFQMVCDLAGLDAGTTRAALKGLLADAAAIKKARAALDEGQDQAPSAGLRYLLSAGKLRMVGTTKTIGRRRVDVPGPLRAVPTRAKTVGASPAGNSGGDAS